MAAAGFDATGMDLVPAAVKSAEEWYTNLPDGHALGGKLPGSVDFRCGNFFDEHKEHTGEYDLVFDCTFLCALNPATYAKWAEEMALITKKGGELVTLIFPIGKKSPDGPPYAMTPELLEGLLGEWFECVSMVNPLPDELSHKILSKKGVGFASALAVWRRK